MNFDNINISTINQPDYGTSSFILKRITYRELKITLYINLITLKTRIA